jgi:PucR C-terminal helix-turn-helix domain/Purine catabolism regulatory protein-like family
VPLSVQDLLDRPAFRLRAGYLPAAAVGRRFTESFTTDLLDPSRYIAPGMLVLTGLVWYSGPDDSTRFVDAVAEGGAGALLVGEGLLGYIPADVVAACERRGLPVLIVPADVSFADIADAIALDQSSQRVGRLTASLERQRDLLTEVYRGAELDDLVGRIALDAGLACWILTATGTGVVRGTVPLAEPTIDRLTRSAVASDRTPVLVETDAGPYSVFVVGGTAEHRTAAWFLVVAGDWTAWHPHVLDTVNELAGVAGLYRLQRQGEPYGWSEVVDQAVAAIEEDADAGEKALHLRHCGLDPDGAVVLVVAAFDDRPDLQSLALWLLGDAVGHLGRPLIGRARDGAAVAIVPVDPSAPEGQDRVVAVLERMLGRLADGLSDDLAVGVSQPATRHELSGALRAARFSLLGGERVGHLRVASGSTISSALQLMTALPDHVRRAYADAVLGAVLDYDARHGGELVPTLQAFLDCDGSWTRTAERLRLHLNTVRYRMGRVEQLTGRDLATVADRTDLHLALGLR